MTIYKINKLVYLDTFSKCYKNIFIIDNPPLNDISLNLIVKQITTNKLSPFTTFSNCCENNKCVIAFIHKNTNNFIIENDIDILFSQLIEAGFTIEYEMTKLVTNKNFICFISKN